MAEWIPLELLFERSPRQRAKGTGSQAKVDKVPSLISHCTIAVQKKGHDFRAAWNICRASMTRYGYLKGPFKEKGGLKTVAPTQKGVRRSMKHAMERAAPVKYKLFKRRFAAIEPGVKDDR